MLTPLFSSTFQVTQDKADFFLHMELVIIPFEDAAYKTPPPSVDLTFQNPILEAIGMSIKHHHLFSFFGGEKWIGDGIMYCMVFII